MWRLHLCRGRCLRLPLLLCRGRGPQAVAASRLPPVMSRQPAALSTHTRFFVSSSNNNNNNNDVSGSPAPPRRRRGGADTALHSSWVGISRTRPARRGSPEGGAASLSARLTSPSLPSSSKQQSSSAGGGKRVFTPKMKPGEDGQPGPATRHEVGGKTAVRTSMKGRFNRVTAQRGLFFASVLYLVGETMTVGLTLLLHCGYLGPFSDIRYWTRLLLGGEDAGSASSPGGLLYFLDAGPMLSAEYDLTLSPRLLLHYAVSNALLYPLYPYQYAFCDRVLMPLLRMIGHLVRRNGGKGGTSSATALSDRDR